MPRSYGLDDRAIHNAVQVIGYFNITRVADALEMEPESLFSRRANSVVAFQRGFIMGY